MSDPREPIVAHHRQLGRLAAELEQLRKALPTRERFIVGLVQAARVALAASLGYFAAQAVGLEQGFWAAITAISVTQNSFAEVKSSSRDQFIGAIFGGVLGLAAAAFGHGHYLAYVFAVMLGTLLCWVGNLGAAGRITAITTTIIMLVPHTGAAFWQIALLRLGEVMVGAVGALLVTALVDRTTAALGFSKPE